MQFLRNNTKNPPCPLYIVLPKVQYYNQNIDIDIAKILNTFPTQIPYMVL